MQPNGTETAGGCRDRIAAKSVVYDDIFARDRAISLATASRAISKAIWTSNLPGGAFVS